MEPKKNILVNGGYPLHTFEDVEAIFQNYISSVEDRKQIRAAYDFIVEKHQGQLRKSGEPYYHHLVEVAYIVASLQGGPATIISAFLHDVVEDTDVTVAEIEKRWGSEVAKIVDALTKIQRLKLSKISSDEFEAEDHRKILIGMAKDIRVIIIKLCDRLHNLRTLEALSDERQIAISQETIDVFVPIAHRLGLDVVKSEMEDLCLKYLEPEKYYEIKKLLSNKAKTMGKSLDAIRKRIADILFENNIAFDISARVKSIYSIYTKMYVKGHPFDEIYDILALRIITDTEMKCYEILGLIHKTYKPVPGRFKDYIAMPKPNMYQSLHTTIVSGNGNFYEIQIRTKEMDNIAETGVAAHWAYKENSGYSSRREQQEIEDKLHWFRDFVSATNDSVESNESDYLNNLSKDIFEANVYVFTPKGKVIELPSGSTPVDFAYRIHTKVGDNTTGAIVNGVMVPL
ncbi:MAG: RelA/SpoT family protein, partial [Candidatus Paceibacterota bacterium]|nr:RelA/SpoT family protein [Acholeplasmataceae bacterium]